MENLHFQRNKTPKLIKIHFYAIVITFSLLSQFRWLLFIEQNLDVCFENGEKLQSETQRQKELLLEVIIGTHTHFLTISTKHVLFYLFHNFTKNSTKISQNLKEKKTNELQVDLVRRNLFRLILFYWAVARLHLISSSIQLLIRSQILAWLQILSCFFAFLFSEIKLAFVLWLLLFADGDDRLCVACSFFLFHSIQCCWERMTRHFYRVCSCCFCFLSLLSCCFCIFRCFDIQSIQNHIQN